MKRVFCLILCIVFMLVPAISCSEKPADSSTSDTQKNDEQKGETSEAEDENTTAAAPNLPPKNYNGTEFVILDRDDGDTGWGWSNRDIIAEEMTGEGINDAVYYRNLAVEEKYNIKITQHGVHNDTMLSTLRNVVQAGDNAYDLIAPNFEVGLQAAQNNLLYDLTQRQYINLEASYWDQNMMESTSIGGHVFYMIGDISIMANDGTWILMFNKQAVEDNGIENLYNLVKENKWTMDKFYELASGFSKDINGDGKFTDTDEYGLVTSDDMYQGFLYSTGFNIINKGSDGLPVISELSEKTVNVAEKIVKIMKEDNTVFNNSYQATGHLAGQAVFEAGRGLFYGEVLQCVIRLREMDIDFGVLPLPKYDESQEKYTTYIHPWASSTIAIPWSASDIEKSEIILEEMAYQSQKYLTPAYYDQALKSKAMRDEESSEMLDIILEGRTCDIGYISNIGGLYGGLRGMLISGKSEISSFYAKMEKAALKGLEKMVDQIMQYSEN